VQADSIVPGTGNTQAWDRYTYVNNSPINFSDPTGHYGKDVHFDLTFDIVYEIAFEILSLKFSDVPNEILEGVAYAWADKIASTNLSVDHNPTTSPGTFFLSKEGQPASEYYHFSSKSDAENRLIEAIQNHDPNEFAKALHSYQDSYSHIESGYSYKPGLEGINELREKCPTCFSKFSLNEINSRATLWGHLGTTETDNYSANRLRDILMTRGTRVHVTTFLLEYYRVDAREYYSEILGQEVI